MKKPMKKKTQPPAAGDWSALLDARLFRALCDPNRLALLARMGRQPEAGSVSDLACCCPVDLSVVSRHLGVLREAGIVEAQRKGKEVHYRLRGTHVARLLRSLADALESCCPDSGESLRAESTASCSCPSNPAPQGQKKKTRR